MELFLSLLLAHLLADFPLQTDQLFRFKYTSSLGLVIHVLIYHLTTLLFTSFQSFFFPWVIGLTLFHYTLDWAKLRLETHYHPIGLFIVDQILHIFSLLFVAIVIDQQQILFSTLLPIQLLYLANGVSLILALMVMVWIWACTTKRPNARSNQWVVWAQRQLLGIEQRIGWGLMLFLLIFSFVISNRPSQITHIITSMIRF